MKLYDLKTNHEKELLGLDQDPYFSWKLKSEEEDTCQSAYRLLVSCGGKTVWDTGKVESAQQTFVPYQGEALESAARYAWTVTAWDNHGNEASAETWFETAFLHPMDWKAVWVQTAQKPAKRKKGFGNQPAPVYFRRAFTAPEGVVSARLYATCHGIYEASVNGARVDGRAFAPEYSSYDKVLFYQVYDVTSQIRAGENVLGMYVADGWYFCPQTTMSKKTAAQPYAVLYQLEMTDSSGKKTIVCSDGSEKTSRGPVDFADLFAGEQYDASRELPGWDAPGFNDAAWANAAVARFAITNLAAQIGAPVRAVKEVAAVNAYVSPKGEHIVDFGQVLSGHARFRIPAGLYGPVTVEHFEIPDLEGNFFNNILGTAGVGEGCDQKDVYIADGREAEYEAKFSFHGFRYVRVSGLPEVKAEDFTAVAMSTEKEELGTFACSDSRINRLYENTRWSQRSNMLSIPTDCPQREKAGWTGDIGVYAATAVLNEDVTNFLTRWMASVEADQMADGAVPMVVPNNQTYQSMGVMLKFVGGLKGNVGVAGWGDACVLVPLAIYEQTGNDVILKRYYPAMKKWADFIIHTAKKYRGDKNLPKEVDELLWNTGFHYGEWLIPSKAGDGLVDGKGLQESIAAGKKYITETYAVMTMNNLSRIAGLLGKEQDASYYEEMGAKMRKAFADGIITPDGKMPVDVMGSYIIPLHHGLVPEQFRDSFVATIRQKIAENHGCLDTGFLGTPVILDTLSENGYVKEAYDILFQEQCPSWLYEVNNGATTIWESWITKKPDGSPIAASLNHYAFGCVDDWMFRHINGIVPTAPGYRTFKVQPAMDERLTCASRTYETEYGKIAVDWKREGTAFAMNVTVPVGTRAEIVLPDGQTCEKGSGTYAFTCEIPAV